MGSGTSVSINNEFDFKGMFADFIASVHDCTIGGFPHAGGASVVKNK